MSKLRLEDISIFQIGLVMWFIFYLNYFIDFFKNIECCGLIGRGGFGQVFRVKLNGQVYALKCEKIEKKSTVSDITNEAKVYLYLIINF